jgi:hypothetical protein
MAMQAILYIMAAVRTLAIFSRIAAIDSSQRR